MNYEMLHLENLIEKRIRSKSKFTKNIDSEITKEFDRLSILFLRSTVFLSKNQLEKFIQGHQQSLLHLLESILSLNEEITTDKEFIIDQGCRLLRVLMRELPKAFNFRAEISMELLKFLNPEIRLSALLAKKKLEMSTSYSGELKNILVETISIDKQEGKMVSLETLSYLSVLITSISRSVDKGMSEKDLLEVLISISFNEPMFLNYCSDRINPVREHEKLTEAMVRLLETRKKIQQIIPNNQLCYLKTQPKTAEFLKEYLKQEISSLHKLSKMIKNFEQGSFLDSRFKVSLSVKQLALFIQLQVACGIILEEKPKFIHSYIISHYSTSTTESISEKSFKNGYYVHSPEDLKKIIYLLSKMIAKAKGQN